MVTKRKKAKTSRSKKNAHATAPARSREDHLVDGQAEDIYARVKALTNELESVLVFLEAKHRRGMLRLPPRAGPVVELVLRVARDRGLLSGKAGESRAERSVAQAASLRIAEGGLQFLAQAMRDTLRVWEARAWGETTALYSALWTMSRYDESLRDSLGPAREFFKKRRRGRGNTTA